MNQKRVFIIHGWGGSPDEPLHKWLKSELEKKGFEVVVERGKRHFTTDDDMEKLESALNAILEIK